MALAGGFDPAFHELPEEVPVAAMRVHQRYFAVVDRAGRLQNRFVAVAGTPVKDPAVSRHGYERVLRARLADRHIELELSEAARDPAAREGYDPVYGARPLKREIQQEIQNPLALQLLEGNYREGETVEVDVDRDKNFVFKKMPRIH